MSSRLCSRCERIPFDRNLKTLRATDYSGPTSWTLGAFGELRGRTCPFCRLVVPLCQKDTQSWSPIEPPDEFVEITVDFSPTIGFQVSSSLGSSVCIAADPADIVERESQRSRDKVYRVKIARETLNKWIDFDDVKRWISACESSHGDFCPAPQRYNPGVLPRNTRRQLDFRLIDVKDMRIVYAPRRCRYITLSYVWGEANDGRLLLNHNNEDSLMQPGSLTEMKALVPQTILDAMTVVGALEERYLWVDSLCLFQDDPDELRECTTIMDLFYEMAVFTIIAGSGLNAHSGLPGVPPTPRKVSRLVREVVPGLKMTPRVDIDTVLRRSVYSKRAWTMQEEVLSSRALIFVNDQIYFRCPSGLCSEEVNWRGKPLTSDVGFGSLYGSLIVDDSFGFDAFRMMIRYYGLRSLTFPSDVLRAAQGMLRKYSILSGIHTFEGLPSPFEQSFLFYRDVRRSDTLERQFGFPSYTWTGWKNSVFWADDVTAWKTFTQRRSNDNGGLIGRAEVLMWILWHCKFDDGQIYRISDLGRLRRVLSLPTPEEARLSSSPRFQNIPVAISDTNLRLVRVGEYPLILFWTVCINLKLMQRGSAWEIRDKYDEECGEIELDHVEPEITTVGKVAIIAESRDGFWGLLLEWKDEIAERRGMVRLNPSVLDDCLPPGPRWKAIALG